MNPRDPVLPQDELALPAARETWRSRTGDMAADYVPTMLTVVAGIALWQLAYLVIDIPKYILPSPYAIVVRMNESFAMLNAHSWVTLKEIVLGFAGGVLLGVVFSLLITQSRLLSKTLYTLIIASQVVPKVAIAPLLVVWFGYGMLPKVLVTMLLAFFPVVISGVTGLLAVSPDTVNVMRSVAASRWQIFSKVMFQNSLPYLFSGLKVAVTLAVVGAIVGEWVGSDAGLGYLIQIANSQIDTELMFAAFSYLIVIGIVLFGLVALIERIAMPWHEPIDISATL